MTYSLAGKKIWVAGHGGMVGGSVVRRLKTEQCTILAPRRRDLDLLDQQAVRAWVAGNRPHVVVVAAARVGGIHANDTQPASFIYENLVIETNIVDAAHRNGVEKLLFLGSSCIYPREAPQPITESALLTGPLEPTNQWYAVAKIAGIKLCEAYRRQYGSDFISAMPTNLYGPGDNFHPTASHVPAALLRRFHEAKQGRRPRVEVWGTGTPRREFLHVDDLADACVFLLRNYSESEHVNVGTGQDVSIAHFAELVARTVGYEGEIVFDTSRPDGTPRKVLDVSRLDALGWRARINLEQGLADYYAWFLANQGALRQ